MTVRFICTIASSRHRLHIMHGNAILRALLRIVDTMLLARVSLVEMGVIIHTLVGTSRNKFLVIINPTTLALRVARMVSGAAADSQHPEHASADTERGREPGCSEV